MINNRTAHILLLSALILSSFWYIGSALTAVLLIVIVVMGTKETINIYTWKIYALTYLMLAYLTWLIIVDLSSTMPNPSMMTMAMLIGLPVIYLIESNLSSLAKIWQRLSIGFFILAIGLAIWGLWQVLTHASDSGPVGPLNDRNAFAALMNLLWFPSSYLLLNNSASRFRSILFGIGMFIIGAALFATASRGGIASWLLLIPILIWASWRSGVSKSRIFAILLIMVFAYATSASFATNNNVADRSFALNQDASTSARLALWSSSIQMATASPFTGTGWGTFVSIYPQFRSLSENTSAGTFAHNDYLQFASEGGIPALLILIALLLSIVWQLRKGIKLIKNPAGLESITLLLGTLAIFIHAALNFIVYYAFMNIIAALYLARSSQLIDSPRIVTLPALNQINRPIKYMLSGFITLIIATPFILHLIAQFSLTGSQPALKLINKITPNINAYDIAKIISSIRPEEGIAQQFMLKIEESSLADSEGISVPGVNFQRELMNETLERFDTIRSQTGNNPNIGVREAKILIQYHAALPSGVAYAKVGEVISANLKADPYHAESFIMKARLQATMGNKAGAISTLEWATTHILSQRDHQLLDLEILRLKAAPKIISELDVIDKQLHTVNTESETPELALWAENLSKHIDIRLKTLSEQLDQAH